MQNNLKPEVFSRFQAVFCDPCDQGKQIIYVTVDVVFAMRLFGGLLPSGFTESLFRYLAFESAGNTLPF